MSSAKYGVKIENQSLRQELNAKRKNAVGHFEFVINCIGNSNGSGNRRSGSNAARPFYCHSAILNQYDFFEKKYDESTSRDGNLSIELEGYSNETVENILEYIYTQDKKCLKVTANNFEVILKLAKYFTIPKNEISILSMMELDQVKNKPQLISVIRKFMQSPEFKDEFCELNYSDMKQIFDSIQNLQQKKKFYLDWLSFNFAQRRKYYKEYKRLYPSDDSENSESSSDEQLVGRVNGSASGSRSQVSKLPTITPKKTLAPHRCMTVPAVGGVRPLVRLGRKRGSRNGRTKACRVSATIGPISLHSGSDTSDAPSESNESSSEESTHSSTKGKTGAAKVIDLEHSSGSDSAGSELASTSAKRTRSSTPVKKPVEANNASPKLKIGGKKILIPRRDIPSASENKPWLIYTVTTNKEVFMEAFNPEIASSNRRIHQFSNPREYSGLAYVDNIIYHIGGNKNIDLKTFYKSEHLNATFPSTNEVDVFNYQHFPSLVEPELKIPVLPKYKLIGGKGINVFSSVVHNQDIYVIGGNHTAGKGEVIEVTAGVARLNTATKTWTNCNELRHARGWHTSIILDDKIYVMGGFVEEAIKSVEVWDIESTRGWRLLEEKSWMNDYRTCCRAFTWNGKIYVAGGCGRWGEGQDWTDALLNTVEDFDPKREANGWTRKSSMIRKREDFAVWSCEDSIYVIGGESGKSSITMEKYDPRGDKWTLMLNVSFPSRSIFSSSITIPASYIRQREDAEDEA